VMHNIHCHLDYECFCCVVSFEVHLTVNLEPFKHN
jgi:hypothetical protein